MRNGIEPGWPSSEPRRRVRKVSSPLPELSVWRDTAGSCKTGGPGRVSGEGDPCTPRAPSRAKCGYLAEHLSSAGTGKLLLLLHWDKWSINIPKRPRERRKKSVTYRRPTDLWLISNPESSLNQRGAPEIRVEGPGPAHELLGAPGGYGDPVPARAEMLRVRRHCRHSLGGQRQAGRRPAPGADRLE